MRWKDMGKVLVEAKVENSGDVWNARQGTIPFEKVRSVVIPDALVDTGATSLSLPKKYIQALGLLEVSEKNVLSSVGSRRAMMYSSVRLTIQGRECTLDVLEVPDGVPALVGYIALENLDFVVDPKGQRLIGNPEHGGEQMYDMYLEFES